MRTVETIDTSRLTADSRTRSRVIRIPSGARRHRRANIRIA
jgi:hypothetical protein